MGMIAFFSFIMIVSLFSILFTKQFLRIVCILIFVFSSIAVVLCFKARTTKVENTITTFVEEYSEYISSTPLKVVKITPAESLPDGCHVYSVILINFDSTYTYSAVLDPEDFEVINFYLEESIPRLKFI